MVGSSNREAGVDDDIDADDNGVDPDDPSEKAAGANWILGCCDFDCEFTLAISSSSSSSESLMVAPSAENELPMPAIPRMFAVLLDIVVLWTLLAMGVLSEGAIEAAARARLLLPLAIAG